jgi:hypothetical protein
MIRYIIWPNQHAANERLLRIGERANAAFMHRRA